MTHIQTAAIGIGMILSDRMLHAYHITLHPQTCVILTAIEDHDHFLGERSRSVVGIVGDVHLCCLPWKDRLLRVSYGGAPAPGIDITDGHGVFPSVGEGKGMVYLTIFLIDGAEVMYSFVVLE